MSATGEDLRHELNLYTEANLMAMLGVSQATLQEWRMKGSGPRFAKLGKSIFYRKSDVMLWINDNIFTTTAPLAA
jgi:predicted DNA-binding transcriptional regulator AlpA